MDTSVAVKWEAIEGVEKYTDLFYVDLKHVDDNIHRKYVGASNKLIIKNIEKIANEVPPEKVVIRIPFIPTVNGDKTSIERIADFIKRLEVPWSVHLLPYHRMAERKYRLIGRKYPMKGFHPPTREEVNRGVESYRRLDIGVEVVW